MKKADLPESPGRNMPLDSQRPMVSHDPDNLSPTQLPKTGYKEVKTNKLHPIQTDKSMLDRADSMLTRSDSMSPFQERSRSDS